MKKFFLAILVSMTAIACSSTSTRQSASESEPIPAMGVPAPRTDDTPVPAMGVPAPPPKNENSSFPPGAVGMPAAPTTPVCNRAAAAEATYRALTRIHNTEDCAAYSVQTEQIDSKFQVKVDCGSAGVFGIKVQTAKLAEGCKSVSSKFVK